MKDMKAALGNASKPDITHVRTQFMTYIARACEYGSAKYERGNYLRQCGDGGTKANFYRFSQYLRSAWSHIGKTLDAMELHLANDPNLEDVEGMRIAMYAADTDETPGAKVGASLLPHVAHGAAGFMMAVVQAVVWGDLPEDPGQTWAVHAPAQPEEPPEPVAPPEKPTQDVRETVPGVYRCQHGAKVGVYCTECQNPVRRPVPGTPS